MHENLEKRSLKYEFGLNEMNVAKSIRQGETSSGYCSRDSAHEEMVPRDSPINTPKAGQSSCSCGGKSNSDKSLNYYSKNVDMMKRNSPKQTCSNSSASTCCQQGTSLAKINEQLLLRNRLLEEQNHSLLDDLQVSRRFYQGLLSDLTAKLSVAETRVKYLNEVVCTQESALSEKQEGMMSDRSSSVSDGLEQRRKVSATSSSFLQLNSDFNEKSRSRSVASSSCSLASEMTTKTKRSPLQGKHFVAKMKEHLVEKNQNLKTDIQLLKGTSNLTRTSSVPILSVSEEDPPQNADAARKDQKPRKSNEKRRHVLEKGSKVVREENAVSSRKNSPHR